jgi:hypothetical protein
VRSFIKKPGKPTYIAVPKRDLLDEQYVRAQLKMIGCTDKDIEVFIGQNRESPD